VENDLVWESIRADAIRPYQLERGDEGWDRVCGRVDPCTRAGFTLLSLSEFGPRTPDTGVPGSEGQCDLRLPEMVGGVKRISSGE
jgi:hypothetical protein